jgi:nucleotide-binding universal stress UspA family protein
VQALRARAEDAHHTHRPLARFAHLPLRCGQRRNITHTHRERRRRQMISFKHILVPVDFGEPSDCALETAIDLAKQYSASVTLVHTWEYPPYAYTGMEFSAVDLLGPIQKAAREQLDQSVAKAQKALPPTANVTGILRQGVAWQQILSTIEEVKPDLVVMGTHGRRGVKHALLGSVAEKIVRTSMTPVLTIRAAEDVAEERAAAE